MKLCHLCTTIAPEREEAAEFQLCMQQQHRGPCGEDFRADVQQNFDAVQWRKCFNLSSRKYKYFSSKAQSLYLGKTGLFLSA